jgi:probable rRNA maturation factor
VNILISSRFIPRPCSNKRLRTLVFRTLKCVRATQLLSRAEVSVRIVGLNEMRRLNRLHRGKDRPTDVLSFPQGEGWRMPRPPKGPIPMGDVVICWPVTKKQAEKRGIPPREEAEMLFVHGLLHLLGWDHDGPRKERAMFDMQNRVLNRRKN